MMKEKRDFTSNDDGIKQTVKALTASYNLTYKNKYTAQNRYDIQTTNDTAMKQRSIDR